MSKKMSDDNLQEKEPDTKKRHSSNWLLLFAGVAGLALGAVLYAFLGGNDNGANGSSPIASQQQGENHSACAVNKERQALLNGAAKGQLAGFQATDRAYSLRFLSFKDGQGQQKTLADWQGKTVLLNLWATWCAPCRAEMPALDRLQKQRGGDDFDVVAVSVDLGSPEKPQKFFKDVNLKNLGFYHDGDLASLSHLKRDGLAFGLPATLLINDKGCLLGTLNGPAEWASEDAITLIKTAIGFSSAK